MSRAANLVGGTLLALAVYAVPLLFFLSALGVAESLSLIVGGTFAVPPFIAGWFSFRKNPDGRWWIAPVVTVLAMVALISAAIAYVVLTMDRL